jgi:predicted RNA-binding Zn-ribbon protein involved in translation (DUF1610 family)
MCSEEERLILGWFMERSYYCMSCGTTLDTCFTEEDQACPDCGCVMVDRSTLMRNYICAVCGYWNVVDATLLKIGEAPMCECGEALPDKYITGGFFMRPQSAPAL